MPAAGQQVSEKLRQKSSENMFHIRYPARKDFWSWTELGCLARALGYPQELFRTHVNDEVHFDDEGISLLQLRRMIELKLLHHPLHRSFNLHTADWNVCVIRKSVQFLQLSAFSFEGLHNIRMAYDTYEAADMKGLHLTQRTLLRTLKMCNRIISPKKLMHRVKHMRDKLEEEDRIQLYELFDLVLWCDCVGHGHRVDHVETVDGKDRDLFKLADFETLLSPQDQRLSRALDERYLAEEWDFGRESLGSKHMFKDEVVKSEKRLKQSTSQKQKYQHLKKAVSQSQRQVYVAHVGSLGDRPISAPDLQLYATRSDTAGTEATSAADVLRSVQRRFHSAPSRASKLDMSDRPVIPEYVRVQTPSVVTRNDLDEVAVKMQNLQFDMVTLESRCQIRLEDERKFYIPDYTASSKEISTCPDEKEEEEKEEIAKEPKEEHWTPQIIDDLAYPPCNVSSHHAQNCDARFRGWRPGDRKGHQRIFTDPTFNKSPHGKLLAKQRSAMMAPVADLRKDYVVRYTGKKPASQQLTERRLSSVSSSFPSVRDFYLKRAGSRSARTPRSSCFKRLSPRHSVDEEVIRIMTQDGADGKPHELVEAWSRNETEICSALSERSEPESSKDVRQRTPDGEPEQEEPADKMSELADTSDHQEISSRSLPKNLSTKDERQAEDGDGSAAALVSQSAVRRARCKTLEMGQAKSLRLLESIQEHDQEQQPEQRSTSSSISSSTAPDSASQITLQKQHVRNNMNIARENLVRPQGRGDENEQNFSNQKEGRRPTEAQESVKATPVKESERCPEISAKSALTVCAAVHGNAKTPTSSFPLFGTIRSSEDPVKCPRVMSPSPTSRTVKDKVGQRKDSGTSCTLSEDSQSPTPLTALTSVTVTIRNKDQQILSCTRVNKDLETRSDTTTGTDDSKPPSGVKQSVPRLSDTSRRYGKSSYANAAMSTNLANHRSEKMNTGKDKSKSATGKIPYSQNRGRGSLKSSSSGTTTPDMGPTTKHLVISGVENNKNSGVENKESEHRIKEQGVEISKDPSLSDEVGSISKRKKSIQFSLDICDAEDLSSGLPMLKQSSSKQEMSADKPEVNTETACRFIFNKATTRRLLDRVHDVISPELRTRISTGNAGLSVV